jgi:hypothetical protein
MNRNTIKTLAIAGLLAASGGARAWGQFGSQSQGYGNPYGNTSNSAQVYSQGGKYLGNLNDNRYDNNSVSNPYGRYGSRYSQDSINNPYGPYGNLYDDE